MTERLTDEELERYAAWTTGATGGMIRRMVAEIRELRAFNYDAVLDDLHELVRALGLPDVARPISPHEVMRECIHEVNRLRAPRRKCGCVACRGLLTP
jgi:hypothetical protein